MRDLFISCDLCSIDADYTQFYTRLSKLKVVHEQGNLFFLPATRLSADSVRRYLAQFLHLRDSLFVGELAQGREPHRKVNYPARHR